MKRIWISLVSLATVAAVLLTGCGGSSKPTASSPSTSAPEQKTAAAKVSLTYWTPLTGGDGDFMKAMVDKFNSSQDKIFVEINTSVWENYYTKLTTAMGAGEAPDVAIIHMANLPMFTTKNALLPLDDLATKAGFDANDFAAIPWKGSVADGKRVAIPLDVHPLIWFYNQDTFEKAGLIKDGRPQVPTSWAELMTELKTIKDKTGKNPMSVQEAGWTGYREWFSYLYQNGGQLLTDDMKKAAFNSPAGIAALKAQMQIVDNNYTPHGLNSDTLKAAWLAGDIGIQPNGVWNTGGYEQAGMKFFTTPLPQLFQKPAVWANSHTLTLPRNKASNPEKQQAAITFIKWISDNSIMWAKAGQIPARKSVVASADFKAFTHQPTYALNLDAVVYPPATPKLSEVENAIYEQLQGAYAHKSSPEDALKAAEAKVNDILSK
ncbi:MAG TPA: ABC transporter substrate-binding protein [Symbiobacteriaceae bacterium]|nr:ABC transporter substrate-binding protein [Symbiobacteriaceae bacterium]